MIGTVVSHYKILEKLGEGGMGVVYRAEDVKLARIVALKFLPAGLDAHEPERARFLQEARAAAALNHPNICTIHDIAEHDGHLFIVMEYVDGTTLREIIPVRKMQDGISYAIQIGEALQEAHAKGIVHRDIKAENIMVNSKNQAKVMDFGLAKLKGSLHLTRTSSTVGTLAYMSPEQIQGQGVDVRSDIFSFGIVLYEMLAGHLPFRGEHEAAMMYSIVNEQPAPLGNHLPNVPSELIHILDRALEKDPEDRYQSAHELVIDLRRLKKQTSRVSRPSVPAGEPEHLTATSEGPAATARASSGVMRSVPRTIVWGIAGAFVIAISILGWLLFRSEPQRAAFSVGRSSKITSEPGVEIDPALSPDGAMIAYAADLKGTMRVFVKHVAGGRALCLTESMPGYQRLPSWSSDGSHIAFSSSEPEGAMYVVTALGGAPRKVAEGLWGAAWSPDGKQLVRRRGGDSVFIQTPDGRDARSLAAVYEPHSFRWSPEGSLIAFVSGKSSYALSRVLANVAPSSIQVVSVATGKLVEITDNTSLNMSPVWTNDSRSLLFLSDRDGLRDIYAVAVDRTGQREGSPRRITTGLNAYTITLSGNGRTLAYSVLSHTANVWSIPIPVRGPISVSEAVQVTIGNQVVEGLDVSPDAHWLAYDSNREGNQDIYKMSLDGGGPIQMTTDAADDFLPSWSPDGEFIAFYSFRTGNRDLFLMSADGGHQQQITRDISHERYPDWSPDGRRLVFYSDRTGRQELYIATKNPDGTTWSDARQLTHAGADAPRWSPDGGLIAYAYNDSLWVISPDGGHARLLVGSTTPPTLPSPAFPAWSADGQTVYYKAYDRSSQQSSIWAVAVSGGPPKLLVRFDDPTRQSHRSEFAARGGRFFITISEYESDIWKADVEVDTSP